MFYICDLSQRQVHTESQAMLTRNTIFLSKIARGHASPSCIGLHLYRCLNLKTVTITSECQGQEKEKRLCSFICVLNVYIDFSLRLYLSLRFTCIETTFLTTSHSDRNGV